MSAAAINLRPIRPDDAVELAAFHERLSPESQYLRYFSAHPHLSSKERHRFTELDHRDRVGVVAVIGTKIVGWAEYDRIDGTDRAELGVVVEDAFQHHGLGTRLIAWLLERAGECGLNRLVAETLPENLTVRTLLRESGVPCSGLHHDGLLRVVLDVPPPNDVRRDQSPGESGLVPLLSSA